MWSLLAEPGELYTLILAAGKLGSRFKSEPAEERFDPKAGPNQTLIAINLNILLCLIPPRPWPRRLKAESLAKHGSPSRLQPCTPHTLRNLNHTDNFPGVHIFRKGLKPKAGISGCKKL